MKKEDVSKGMGKNIRIICANGGGEGERESEREGGGVSNVTQTRERDDAFLFHQTVETCLSRRWGGRLWWLRARGKTKNEDEVNDIHAGYRILPSRARLRLPSFRLFSFFFPPHRTPALLTFSA